MTPDGDRFQSLPVCAYQEGAHRSAIVANAATSFTTREVFVRYRPYATSGPFDASPALAED